MLEAINLVTVSVCRVITVVMDSVQYVLKTSGAQVVLRTILARFTQNHVLEAIAGISANVCWAGTRMMCTMGMTIMALH